MRSEATADGGRTYVMGLLILILFVLLVVAAFHYAGPLAGICVLILVILLAGGIHTYR